MKLESEDHPTDRSLGGASTGKLFLSLNLLAIAVPALALLVVWGVVEYFDFELEKKHWRRVILGLWLGTLAVLTAWAWFFRRGVGRNLRHANESELVERDLSSADIAHTWELRQSRRLGREIFIGFLLLPLVSLALVYVFFSAQGIPLVRRDWIHLIGVCWFSCFIAMIWLALRSRKPRVMYRGASKLESSEKSGSSLPSKDS